MLVFELNGVAKAFCTGRFDVTVVNSIVFWRGEQIPTVHTVKGPSATFVGFLMHLDFASHGGQWHLVIIKRSTEMNICRDQRSGAGLAEEVDSDFGLQKEPIPEVGWKRIGNSC
jgi:hypothetical protein